MKGGAGGGPSAEDIFENFFGGGFGSFFGGRGGGEQRKKGPRKGEDVVHELEVSLEDLYKGSVRKIRLTRSRICAECGGIGASKQEAVKKCPDCKGTGTRVFIRQIAPGFVQQSSGKCTTCNGDGSTFDKKFQCKECKGKKTTQEKKTLEVHIEKGMKNNQQISFPDEGDELPGIVPGDIIFVLKQKSHKLFVREDSHLVMKKTVTLSEALTGVSFPVIHLDDHTLIVRSPPGEVIKPGSVKKIVGAGMPKHKNPFEKGNLYIKFEVEFPDTIPKASLSSIESALPPKQAHIEGIDLKSEHVEEVSMSDASLNFDKESRRREAYNDEEDEDFMTVGVNVDGSSCFLF